MPTTTISHTGPDAASDARPVDVHSAAPEPPAAPDAALAGEVPRSQLKSGVLSADEQRAWRRPRPLRAALDLASIWLQIGGGVALCLLAWELIAWPLAARIAVGALGWLLIGGGQHGLTLAAHEFAHFSVVPGDRQLNDRLGRWLFCAPVLLPLELYRQRHFEHHRHYSEVEHDTKTVYRHDIRGARLLLEVVRSLTGIDWLMHLLALRNQPDLPGEVPPKWRLLLPLAVCQVALLGGFTALWAVWGIGHWANYAALWALPILTLVGLLNKLRATMEHQPLQVDAHQVDDGRYFMGTAVPFVRSVRSNVVERLFLCHLNFGFHAEHHLWPSISYQYLPDVREKLEAQDCFDDPGLGREASYAATIAKLCLQGEAPADRGPAS